MRLLFKLCKTIRYNFLGSPTLNKQENTRPRDYTSIFILNSFEHEILLQIYVKLPAIVGILIFISKINAT